MPTIATLQKRFLNNQAFQVPVSKKTKLSVGVSQENVKFADDTVTAIRDLAGERDAISVLARNPKLDFSSVHGQRCCSRTRGQQAIYASIHEKCYHFVVFREKATRIKTDLSLVVIARRWGVFVRAP
jgi:hypothetical protein